MKSWITFLLPTDEYKEKRILYFFSEGAIILLLSLVLLVIGNRFLNIDVETALLVATGFFLFYVLGRYIISGIEYTEVATKDSYKKETKQIFGKTFRFAGIFLLLFFLFDGLPRDKNQWIDHIGIVATASLLWFFISYLSLRRSYKKNKELL
ncbi:hypothetical protein [Ferdinandcohnia sp. Marseille-Q9671]